MAQVSAGRCRSQVRSVLLGDQAGAPMGQAGRHAGTLQVPHTTPHPCQPTPPPLPPRRRNLPGGGHVVAPADGDDDPISCAPPPCCTVQPYHCPAQTSATAQSKRMPPYQVQRAVEHVEGVALCHQPPAIPTRAPPPLPPKNKHRPTWWNTQMALGSALRQSAVDLAVTPKPRGTSDMEYTTTPV